MYWWISPRTPATQLIPRGPSPDLVWDLTALHQIYWALRHKGWSPQLWEGGSHIDLLSSVKQGLWLLTSWDGAHKLVSCDRWPVSIGSLTVDLRAHTHSYTSVPFTLLRHLSCRLKWHRSLAGLRESTWLHHTNDILLDDTSYKGSNTHSITEQVLQLCYGTLYWSLTAL